MYFGERISRGVGGGSEDRAVWEVGRRIALAYGWIADDLRMDCGRATIGSELIWERVRYRCFPRTHAKTFVR
jgi:hypothetical protein